MKIVSVICGRCKQEMFRPCDKSAEEINRRYHVCSDGGWITEDGQLNPESRLLVSFGDRHG